MNIVKASGSSIVSSISIDEKLSNEDKSVYQIKTTVQIMTRSDLETEPEIEEIMKKLEYPYTAFQKIDDYNWTISFLLKPEPLSIS